MNIIFDANTGLIPAIVQHADTGQVLMLGYMNQQALDQTLQSKLVTFYSRSRKEIWIKGATSGHYLNLISVSFDCDGDSLLVQARPDGPACHTGTSSCFGTPVAKGFLRQLETVINDKISAEAAGSYTYQLFSKGVNKIAQKVGEEATELVIEAKDENPELFRNEAADLLYHFLLLLRYKEASLEEIETILYQRHRS